jgi:hypothetical protein
MNLLGAALKREAIALAGSEKVDHYRVRVALNAREIEGLVSLFPSSVESEAAHRAHFVLKIHLGFDFENLSLFFQSLKKLSQVTVRHGGFPFSGQPPCSLLISLIAAIIRPDCAATAIAFIRKPFTNEPGFRS